jgi:Tfp pilus assembly PilM family ATPase
MALFGSPSAYIGLDIGTSSLKAVELLNRRRRIELSTYAQANLPNLLLDQTCSEDTMRRVASVITQLLDKAGVSTDAVVAALPNSVVFSTVLTLPNVADKDMDKAVHFGARDVVPADLSETVLGWSRIGELPHMDGGKPADKPESEKSDKKDVKQDDSTVPIFVTAAPKQIIDRYLHVIELTSLNLIALEVETFPLIRSLLSNARDSAMIVDIGDQVTTYHLIDQGATRVSHSIDVGGHTITDALAKALNISIEEADAKKMEFGLNEKAPENIHVAIDGATRKMLTQAQQIIDQYAHESNRMINKTVLIGGGANLHDLARVWSEFVKHPVSVGNPWKGMAVPDALESRIVELGPTFAVAVGLAERQLSAV